jgi:phosphodiesterase/alkaline phosphatase D-like protein
MAWRDSNDKIAELLKEAYPPTAASPEFKATLRQQLSVQAGVVGTGGPRPLWQQPFVWIPAAAASAVAVALIIFFVAFQSVPPTVTTRHASGIQTTTATLNGRLNSLSESESVEVSFEWGATTDYGNETTPELRTGSGDITADLSSLAPNTTYHFRLKLVGPKGTEYGPDMHFTTGPAPPVATTGDAAKIKTTSATLRGSLDALGSAANVSVSFEWGLTTSYGNETTPASKTETGKYSADLSGLVPNTTYHFRAKAVGDDIAYGADAQFTTGTVPPSVETDDATSTGTNSARLNGELTSLGTAAIVNVSFEWGTTTGSYTHTTADQARTSTGAFSADLSGLAPGVTYYYRAKADGDGYPVYGPEKRFTTPTTPPSVTTASATKVRCTSVTLNGILESLGTADSVQVSFEWGTTTSYGSDTTAQSMTAAGAFTANLSGLTANTTYHFRAKAAGDSIAYGADMMFMTGRALPPQTTWHLSGELYDSVYVMYHDNTSKPIGIVPLHSNGLSSVSEVWRADQSLAGTTCPGDNWTVHLALSHLRTDPDHEVIVEIGTLDGNDFISYGSHTFIASGTNNQDVYEFEFSVSVNSFTVPSNSYVATRITVTNRYRLWVDVHIGGEQSYVTSPAYPEPTAPVVTTSAATDVEETTAVLNGYLDSLGTAGSVTVCFEWGTTTAYDDEIEVGSQISDGSFSFVLADLDPNTTYHFRAKVVGDGTNYGIDLTFTTPP